VNEQPTPKAERRGFTLLEVMVAIAILGLGLTMILSSQAGLFASAKRGQSLTVATNLARCKMTEVELELLKTGYPPIDQTGEGSCCGDEGELGYRCAWKVERVELPDPSQMMDGGADASLDPLGALSQFASPSSSALQGPAALQNLSESMGTASMASGLGPMVMGFVYPAIKPMLEASIRKVTVRVDWKEGITPRELVITQYVTDPQQGGLSADAGLNADGGVTLPSGTGASPTGLPGFGSGFGAGLGNPLAPRTQ